MRSGAVHARGTAVADDPLEDPDTVAALQLIGARQPAGMRPCPGCGRVWIEELADHCAECTAERQERVRAAKRDWWHNRSLAATKRERAASWLVTTLRRGPLQSVAVYAKASRVGISTRTLQRAARDVGVVHERRGQGREHHVVWRLP